MVLEQYIHIPVFTSGERLAIFRQVRTIAIRLGLTDVATKAERGLIHDHGTRELDNRWAERRGGRLYAQVVSDIDNLVDRVLTSIRDIPLSHARALSPDHELVGQVEAMLEDIYPAGLMAVVSLPFVDQVAATEVILDKLQSDHQALIARLAMTERVEYLAELTIQYRDAVDRDNELSFADVEASRQTGQRLLRELIAAILGRFCDSLDPDNVSRRNQLLEPVSRQTQQSRTRRARRRGRMGDTEVLDQDDTGDTVDPDDDDASAASGGGAAAARAYPAAAE